MTMTDTYGTETLEGDAPDELVATAAGWFEACAEHRGGDADGPCTDCGWLATDHTSGLAEVIVVTRRAVATPLRRAS
jgi:hypothetical protein